MNNITDTIVMLSMAIDKVAQAGEITLKDQESLREAVKIHQEIIVKQQENIGQISDYIT